MEPTPDDVAGVVDLFGALEPAELRAALAELAFKQGVDSEPESYGPAIEAAVESYHLVAVDDTAAVSSRDGRDEPDELLVVGPVAFPTLPEGGEDLPHILDVPDRTVDRETAARAAERQFRADAADAVETEASKRIETLLDVSYELEAWGGVDLSGVRERLDASRDETN